MKRCVLFILFAGLNLTAFSQNVLRVVIRDAVSLMPLTGASVSSGIFSSTTSEAGYSELSGLPDGHHTIEFGFTGYREHTETLTFPRAGNDTLKVFLEPDELDLEEVIVSSTRSSRTISNSPTRVEVIAGEELDEKGNMKPGDIRMILNESTGIQTQQTSPISANASIRIQGLDGRYTQILKDGFPLFSGAASGLGLLQTPPLDLKQVEVIKGSASTLYGGGAIAGLVNLISKTPGEERELNIHLNGTSAGGLDLNSFYSKRYSKTGLTLFAARNSNQPYAPGNSLLTAIPKFERYILNPKIYFYPNKSTEVNLGINTSFEKRTGGDLRYFERSDETSNFYYERNLTDRISTQFLLRRKTAGGGLITLKNSISYFNRSILIPGYAFDGTQYGTFSEATYRFGNDRAEWVAGLNLWTDRFLENKPTGVALRDYDQTTSGAFIQHNYHVNNRIELESGLRADHIKNYGISILPRISALFKINEHFSSRIGGGMGYKTPSIFTEESERIQYQNVLPLNTDQTTLETSYGANWDVNYRNIFFNDQVSFSINHLFFYTYLSDPLMLMPAGGMLYSFNNLPGYMKTKGMETNVKLTYGDLKLFIGYTLTDTRINSKGISIQNPLTARHRLNNVLMYEVEEKWKLGAEGYYYSSQQLTDGTSGQPFWIFGFMAEKLWEDFSVYINFENFTDTRQTRFDTIYMGNISSPAFRDIYAPLDGFVINGGIKLKF